MKIKKIDVPFTQVVNIVLFDPRLSWKAKGIFAYIQAKPDEWDFASDRMSKEAKDGVDGTKAGLAELQVYGYLLRKKQGDGRMKYELAIPGLQNPEGENPTLDTTEPKRDIPTEGKPQRGKSPRISNKESNKERDKKKKEGSAFILPGWIKQEVWDEWVQYRAEIKKKLTPATIKRQMGFLEKHKADHEEIIGISITNGWTGLFAKDEGKKKAERQEEKRVYPPDPEYPDLTPEQIEKNKERMKEIGAGIRKLKDKVGV